MLLQCKPCKNFMVSCDLLLFRLQALVPKHNLVIASYDIVRNDIEFFR